ncbi:MAG TPA: response regulator transcription factor [Dongiaceae bacterium]|nr:response regulator transcription factor [Dongiaceae bacterium]
MAVTRIVVAEDDASIRELLVHHLRRDGFSCEEAPDGPAALRLARTGADVLILDLGLPVVDGFEIVRRLRREGRELPIVVLTARSDEIDRIVGLEIGADDYVTKPFSPREVVARVKAIARRAGLVSTNAPVTLTYERLVIDQAAREARVDGVDVGLKPREFALLLELAANPGVALSRSALLQRVWGYDFEGDERTVDVHVRRLRLKLEEREGLPMLLHTVHGYGYRFARA